MLFRGYLPIQSGWMMAEFLKRNEISFQNLKGFLIRNADGIRHVRLCRRSRNLVRSAG
jgi:hypothetical protein